MIDMKEETIRILHLEDNLSDSRQIESQIKKERPTSEYIHTGNKKDFTSCLNTQKIDIVLSAYSLQHYNGIDALRFVKDNYPDIPFVFVSSKMGEEAVIETLKNGATDYVLKNRLDHLNAAITRALRESKLKTEFLKASEALRQREEQYRVLVEGMNEGIMLLDENDTIQFVNGKTSNISGYSYNELIGHVHNLLLYDDENRKIILEQNKLRKEGRKEVYDVRLRRRDGENIWIRCNESPVIDYQGKITGFIILFENINDQKIAEEELRKLKRAVDQSPNSIIITSPDGIIEYANPKTHRLTGFSREELIGQKTNIFKSGEKSPDDYKTLWDTIKSGKIWTGEFHNKKKNGELYWESATVSPIFSKTGEITHFLAIKEDTTERHRLNEELLKAKEKAEESDRLKSAFLANISHEIRTPMNGILGFSELLKMPDLTQEMRDRYIHVIEQSGIRMLNIINDIVDLSKIEAGQENIVLAETNVNQVLKDLLIFFLPEAHAKGINLSVTNSLSDESSTIVTDQTKLTQVLSNLIKNALKFTENGSIEFGYNKIITSSGKTNPGNNRKRSVAGFFNTYSETEPEKTELEFYVQDTGEGIPEDQINFIFDRFRQGSISPSRSYEGAGLGLSISKAYVEMLGGRIWVTSRSGLGSVFHFTLPFNVSESQNFEEQPELSVQTQTLKFNILLAEDDENSRLLLKTLLEKDQANLLVATNGMEAIEMVKENPELDLVLMDLKMPKMDGYEATRQIKKIRPGLPVLAQTAYAFEDERELARQAGCDDYISKPINPRVLEEKIKNLVRK